MSCNTAPQVVCMGNNETLNAAFSFAGRLRSGELLTGTPTITVSPSGPTLSNKVVSTGSLSINGKTVSTGEAVQVTITGGGATVGDYTISVSVGTDDSGTLTGNFPLRLE